MGFIQYGSSVCVPSAPNVVCKANILRIHAIQAIVVDLSYYIHDLLSLSLFLYFMINKINYLCLWSTMLCVCVCLLAASSIFVKFSLYL